MNSLSAGRLLDKQKLQCTQREDPQELSHNRDSSKPKVSRASLLFNEMQMLTKSIRAIDNVQQKLFQQKLLRTNRSISKQVKLSPRKIDEGSLNNSNHPTPPTVTELISKYKHKEPREEDCTKCKRKQQELAQLRSRIRSLQRELQNRQKQVQYLNFQLDLMEGQARNTQPRQLVDSVKPLLRRSLEKFMSEVVFAKLAIINSAVEWVNKKIQKLVLARSLRQIRQGEREQMILLGSSAIRASGEILITTSSSLNSLKRFSSSKTSEAGYSETLSMKTLEASLKEKNNTIFELETRLLSVKKSNIEIIAQYESHIQKLRRLNIQKQLLYSGASVGPADAIARLKQLEERLATSQKQYRKLNERYLSIHKKEQQLNGQLQQNRDKVAMYEKYRQRCEAMEKEMLLQARELQSVRMQLAQQKDNSNSNIQTIDKLRQKLQDVEFELSLKQQQNETMSSNSQNHTKFVNYQKQLKMLGDSNNMLTNQVRRLNQNLQAKSRELELAHDQYRTQLYQKENKLYELEMILKEDFSKIKEPKDYDCKLGRDCENSLVFSTTRMNTSKDIDFYLIEDIVLPEMPSMEQLFITKDFSKVQLDTHYDQEQFLKKVSEYVDGIKQSAIRRHSRSKSRNSSQQKLRQEKRPTQLRKLVHNILAEINRVIMQMPLLMKDQLFKLKSLLDELRQQLNTIQSNKNLLDQVRQLCNSLMGSLSKDKNSKQLDQTAGRLRNLLRLSTP